MKHEIVVRKTVEETISAESVVEAVEAARQLGYEPVVVDEKDVIAQCEACRVPILEGDVYFRDEDGAYVCETCGAEIAKDEPDAA